MKLVMFTDWNTQSPVLVNPDQVCMIRSWWSDSRVMGVKPMATEIVLTHETVKVTETVMGCRDKLVERG